MLKNVDYQHTMITGGFWSHYQDLLREVTIKSIYDRFSETGRFRALSCTWKEGEPGKPHIYWDSDVAKWIEAAAYLCAQKPSPELEKLVDEAVSEMEKNQREDGYFNSYYITCEPEARFTVRGNHELYCAGHLIEAAIAYKKATGKDAFLRLMIRYADCIYRIFYEEKSAAFTTPGHEEIELALLKLYEETGEEKYRELTRYFLEERGKHPEEIKSSGLLPVMNQSDLPLRKMKAASGHAVRANYLYTAAARLAVLTRDEELLSLCRNLFTDITETKMAVTGGVVGFLWFNFNPAKVFMGDMGSMFIGGATVALAMLTRQPFLLLLISFTMVASSASVMIQVTYFKLTHGKRIFKMSPIHHHFELSGMKEPQICAMYTAVTLILSLIAVAGVLVLL